MITKSYTLQKNPYPLMLDKKRSQEEPALSSNYLNFGISNFNINQEPSNHNFKELSFKGSSPIKSFNEIRVSEAIKKFGEIFGKSAEKHLDERIHDAKNYYTQTGLKVENDIISFQHKSFAKRLLDVVLYPITKMPLDIANSTLKGLKKIPGLKKSKTLDAMLNTRTLTERRDFIEHTSDVAAIEHYFEQLSEKKTTAEIKNKLIDFIKHTSDIAAIEHYLKQLNGKKTPAEIKEKLIEVAHTRLKPLLSNYDTTAERTLTRIVTGMIPAFYLANDAYNLSIYMKNDKEDAEKDKKRRFKQEVARIALTAGLTYGVLSLFSKQSNSSSLTTTLLISGLTLASEFLGRAMSGTPIFPVSKKQAKKYAELQDKMYDKKDKEDEKTDSADTFKGFEGKDKSVEYKKPPEKGLLTIRNILKLIGILAIAGLGVEQGSKIKVVKKVLNDINKKYKKILEKEFKISRKEFNELTHRLRENGFGEIADDYNAIIKNQTGDEISLGNIKDKTKNMLINNGLVFPIRFIWDTLMMPYKSILKPIWNIITRTKTPEKEVDKQKKEMERLRDSIQFLQKLDKNKPYKDQINKRILSSFDNVTKSNYSNADLSAVSKTAANSVTSIFLIADNYNQVMVESNGENEPLAEQKAKERTVQRGIRIAYSAFIVKLFNGMFANPYNNSLLGAQLVNVGSTLVTESAERKAVGLPIGKSSRKDIVKKEQENLSATGIKGGYFRLMAKLTGKRSLSEEALVQEKNRKHSKPE